MSRLLDVLRAEIGVVESPAGSNRTKYGEWFGMNGQPWCVMFAMWGFDKAGVELPARTASCTTLMRAAKEAGCWVTGNYQPCDLVIYDFGGDKKADHCGIVEEVTENGVVVAIEGNTGYGDDANGGAVLRRYRTASQIMGAVRPRIEKEQDNTPAPAHAAGVAWALDVGILKGGADGDLMLSQPVTRQQLCTMLYRFWLLDKKQN